MNRILVDSNIPIIASEQIGEAWALVILEQISLGHVEAVTSTAFLLEILDSYWQYGKAFEGKVLAKAFRSLMTDVAVEVSVEDFDLSCEIYESDSSLGPRDCFHAAVAINSSFKKIFSVDGVCYDSIDKVGRVSLEVLLEDLRLKGDYVDDRR